VIVEGDAILCVSGLVVNGDVNGDEYCAIVAPLLWMEGCPVCGEGCAVRERRVRIGGEKDEGGEWKGDIRDICCNGKGYCAVEGPIEPSGSLFPLN
jgi:hypothetical protein